MEGDLDCGFKVTGGVHMRGNPPSLQKLKVSHECLAKEYQGQQLHWNFLTL